MQPFFNFRRRKVGGIWFVRIGRLQLSFCLCRSFETRRASIPVTMRSNPA